VNLTVSSAENTEQETHRLPMRRPLLALSVAFALGILFTDLFRPPALAGWLVAGVATASAAILALMKIGGPLRFLLWLLALLALGVARGELDEPRVPPSRSGKLVVMGTAATGWLPGKDLRRLELDVHAVREVGGDEMRLRGRMRLAVLGEDPCPPVLPGDGLRVLATLRAPRSVKNPGVLDYARLLRRRGIDWTGTADSCTQLLMEYGSGPFSILRFFEQARAGLQRFVASREASPEARGILTALTVGERGRIPEATAEDFRKAGLAHLLAISGLHLGFVAAGLYFLLVFLLARTRKLVLRLDVRRLAAAVVIPVTIGYTLLAGAHLPAVRACIMVLGFLLAVLLRRDSDPLQTLCAAALVILGLWPQSLFEVSFQLSFCAVLVIVLGMPVVTGWLRLPLTRPEEAWWRRFLVRVAHFLLVTLLATLGTAPLVAFHFNQVSVMGLLANLLAVPLAAFLIVPLGLIFCLLYPISGVLAGFFADVGLFLSGLLADLAAWFGGIDFGWFHVATPTIFELILLYATLLFIFQLGRRRWARWAVLAGVVLLIGSWGVGRLSPLLSDKLEMTVIDVGQGDSILVRFPGGDTLLIDCGPAREGGFDAGRRIVAPYLWARGITRLDAVAITHPQADHAGGLPSIIELFRPKEIWTAEPLEKVSGARILRAGDRPRPGVLVLWPPESLEGLESNERSLVLRIVHEKTAFLLTGDLEEEGEAGLLEQDADLSANVLKVGHHGSRKATSDQLLARVQPGIAVISAAMRNPFGFPHRELLSRLGAKKVKVFRTDHHGAVKIVSDGGHLEVTPWVTMAE
jgi:competence protein ComEC